ncbi:hypothetical protein ACFXI8_23460 [Streptomyces niveus]|uniref:hypothetical protein n=1 Tax=Streptomyces niveus TaxID=193462 RepID=UPI0036952E4F
MASAPDRAALAWICQRYEQIRQLGREGEVGDTLDAALGALARSEGDLPALLDRVEELLRHCGWGGSLRGEPGGVPSVGASPGEPLVEAYVCPTARCTRAVFAPRPPLCSFTARALTLKRYGGYGDGHGAGSP